MLVHEDVIYIIPAEIETPKHLQGKTTSSWLKYTQAMHPSFKKYLRGLLVSAKVKFRRT